MNGEDHKQALPPGFSLGSYRVVRVLGVGGFGVTYLCEHSGLGHQVAVKEYLPNEFAMREGATVHPKSSSDRESFQWGLSRFVDEAHMLTRFRHPNLVRVSDYFEANDTAYIVMDYEDGEPLDVLLKRHGTLTEAQLKRVLLPVADGLRLVHAAGFLHRDIKPSNIFVRRSDESPVLLDFGSARQALGRKSRSMTAIASAGYSPPEQYESDGKQGPWTDIYALSALCHRAITGETPMEAPRRQNQLLRSQTDPLPSLAELAAAGYSPTLLAAVDSGLRLVEKERPQSLDEWLALLTGSAAADAPAATARPEEREAEKPRTGAGWLVGATVVAVGLVLYFVQANWPQSTESEATASAKAAPDERTTASSPEAPLQLRAEQGDVEAQFNLGLMYFHGDGVPKDAGQAASWLRKAAEQGHAEAQYNLGLMYAKTRDDGEAVLWYRKAAEQGHVDAQYNLGHMYYKGKGIPKDHAQAASWFRKAAEQGDANAQYNLGLMYAKTGDDGEAVLWYRKAAEQGDANAQNNLGVMYDKGQGVPEDDGKAVLWHHKAAKQGLAIAQYNLGSMYYKGKGVPKDHAQAASWFRKAAEQGDAIAQGSLGWMYLRGDGVPKDAGQAVSWSRKAAEQGHAAAQNNLGSMYHNGVGVPEDYVQAYAWYNLAAAQGTEISEKNRDSLRQQMTPAQIADAQKLSRELVD